jgi:hypothetical protein
MLLLFFVRVSRPPPVNQVTDTMLCNRPKTVNFRLRVIVDAAEVKKCLRYRGFH